MREKGLVSYDVKTYNAKVTLTEEGKKFAIAVLEKTDKAVEAGQADQTEEERKIFYKTLGDIVDNLTEYCEKLMSGKTEK